MKVLLSMLMDTEKQHMFSDGGISVWRVNVDSLDADSFEHFCSLTQNGFSRGDSEELRNDIENHIYSTEGFYVASDDSADGFIFGYFLVKFFDYHSEKVLYLSGAIIHDNYRGRGITKNFLRIMSENLGISYIAARTQNPVMYKSIHSVCEETYPCFSNLESPPEDVKLIADHISSALGSKNYDRDTMIDSGTYGHALYGVMPVHNSDFINSWFNGLLNADNGDSMLIVGITSN